MSEIILALILLAVGVAWWVLPGLRDINDQWNRENGQ